MAKQTGIIKLKGTIGDISFYKSSDGHLARAKGGVDGKRIATDPAFQRTRENGSEFGTAGKGGKLIRSAFRLLLQNAKDKRVVSRLTKDILQVVKTDATNPRGARTIVAGDFGLLNNFEFNINGKLGTALYAPFTNSYDRATGDALLNVSQFVPKQHLVAPEGTTNYKITMATAELDFENETFVYDSDSSLPVPYDDALTGISLSTTMTPGSTLPVIQVMAIEFYQNVNGALYSLKNGAYNSLAIVLTDNN